MSDTRKRLVARRLKPETEARLQAYAARHACTPGEALERLLNTDLRTELASAREATRRADEEIARLTLERDNATDALAAVEKKLTGDIGRAQERIAELEAAIADWQGLSGEGIAPHKGSNMSETRNLIPVRDTLVERAEKMLRVFEEATLTTEPMQPSATRAQRLAAMARALTMSDTNVEENLRSAINLMDNVCDALGCAPEKAAEKAREIAERLARTQTMCTSLTRSVEELSAALIAARQSGATSTSPKMTELEARITAIENRLGRKHIEASDLDRFSRRRHLAWSDPVQAIMTEGARPSWQTRDLVWPDGERHPYERTRGPEIEGAMDALTTPRATLHAGDTGNAPAPDEDADWTVRFRERFGATLEFSDQRQPRRPYVKATITRGDVNDANVEIKKHVSGITEVTVLRPEDT